MRRLFVSALAVVAATSVFALKKAPAYLDARRFGALAGMLIHVVDDLGRSVPNAEVNVFMGMNFRPKGYYIKGISDTNGTCFVAGKTCGDEIIVDVSKQGHYASSKRMSFAEIGAERDVENGRWLPFGKGENIVLRRIVKPIDLIVFDKLVDVAQTNVWLGFDMEKMDFLKPVGAGDKADFELRVEWDGLPAWESRWCSVEIRFPKDIAGGYYAKNISESTFPYVYAAQSDSLYAERHVRVVDRNGDPHMTKISFAKDASFVTRTRCVVGESGQIKAANYGCIRRLEIGPSRRGVALLRLSYIFNPTPNDTNLEPRQ